MRGTKKAARPVLIRILVERLEVELRDIYIVD